MASCQVQAGQVRVPVTGMRGSAIEANQPHGKKKWSVLIFVLAVAIFPVGRSLEIAFGDPFRPLFFPALEIFALGYFLVSLGTLFFWAAWGQNMPRVQRWGWILIPLYRAGIVTSVLLGLEMIYLLQSAAEILG